MRQTLYAKPPQGRKAKMAYKVIFWILIASTFFKMIECAKDHPRTQTHNLGTDMVGFVLNIGLCIWLGISIWN